MAMGTWLLFGVFLVNFYKGEMYTYLTVQVQPDTPQTLEELIQANKIPIVSLSGYVIETSQGESKAVSILKEDVIPDLATISKKQKILHRFMDAVHFSSQPNFRLAKNLSTFGFIWNDTGARFIVGKQGIFAVVDETKTLSLFRQNLHLFGKYKPARAHNSMNFYGMQSVWTVSKNFFAGIFTAGLTSLVERGVYGKWDADYEASIQKEDFKEFEKMGNETNSKIQTNNTCEPEATTLEQVTVPFVIYLGMSLVSIAVFIVEFKHTFKIWLCDGCTLIKEYIG